MTTDTDPIPKAALLEDVRTLGNAIESLHADPYRGYGGKIPFHRQLERLVEDMPPEATPAAFHQHVSPLVTGLQDSHTTLAPPDNNDDNRQLPIAFRVIEDKLIVDEVHAESNSDLLGGHLVAVNGVPIEELIDRQNLRAAENPYGARRQLADRIENATRLKRLFDTDEHPETVTLTIKRSDENVKRTLELIGEEMEPTETLPETISQPTGSGPRYRLYEEGAGAVFVPGDLQGFRESFEGMLERGSDLIEELAPEAYTRHVGAEPPEELAELVGALPSMMETLVDLVTEMEAADTETLIIDLRDNPGGDSTFVYHIAYILYGWEGVARAAQSTTAIKRRTERHQEQYGSPDETHPSTADRNPADYDFGAVLKRSTADQSTVIEHMRHSLTQSETFARIATDDSYAGYYEPPHLIVLTSAKTFSSAFAGVAQLSSIGADVIGVPSGQSPVSFGEAVEETLPNTELTASIAGAAYEWLPEPKGDVLEPDQELTLQAFREFNQATDSILRLAFDFAELTDGTPPEPVSNSPET